MAKDTPVERVQIQAIGTATRIVTDRQQDAGRQRQRHVGRISAGIGAQPVGGGVPERVQPATAHEQIEAHREQAEDQRLDQDRQRVLRHHERQHGGGGGDDETKPPVHLVLLAEQAAGSNDQDEQHEEVHQRQREVPEK